MCLHCLQQHNPYSFKTVFNLPFMQRFPRGEILAVQKAAEYITNVCHCIETTSFRIITDCQSAIKALINPKSKKPFAHQTRQDIINCPIQIVLEWVKAHTDNFSGEADSLAKEAHSILPTTYNRCAQSQITNTIKQAIRAKYYDNYKHKPKSYYSDKFFNSPESIASIQLSQLDTNLLHFITNKGYFSQCLHTIKHSSFPICKSCNQQNGTPEHVIFSCSNINTQ